MKANVRCSILMAAYFALHCVVFSYVTYYLGSIGFSDLFISIVVACACAAGGMMQIACGRFVDRSPKWNWKKLLLVFGISELLLSISRVIVHQPVWQWISYALIIVMQLIMMPMVNLSCFDYSSKGMKVNFGMVRGIGSLAFAASSFAAGKLSGSLGSASIPRISLVLTGVFLTAVLFMPDPGSSGLSEGEKKGGNKKGFASLIKKYPAFFIMVTGLSLMIFFHNMLNTFFIRIVEHVGRGSDSLGIALAVGAFAEIPVLFLYSRISGVKKGSSGLMLLIACGFFVARSVLYLFARSAILIYFVQLLQGASFGLMAAAKSTYADECMKPEDKATGQSMMSFTDALGLVAGTFIGGVLLKLGGVRYMLLGGLVIAVLGTVIVTAAFSIKNRKNRDGI